MSKLLILPQLRCTFEKELPGSQLLLVAGGRAPASEWLIQAAEGFPVWSVDHGVDVCQASGVIPQRLIGDGDSATAAGWAWANQLAIPVEVHPPEKDLTDLQLALQRAGAVYKCATVVLTGAWGGRFDHIFSNIYSLKGCDKFGVRGCCAADEREVLILLKGKDSVQLEMNSCPEAVSLLPLSPECSGVCINGVHWPLADVTLYDTLPYAVSNRPNNVGTKINVAIEDGCIGIYLCWENS